MDIYKKLSKQIYDLFSTDQNYHAIQQKNGTYRKTQGVLTSNSISNSIKNNGSIACYQKNLDSTLKWICFDFDILKANLTDELLEIARPELNNQVFQFCFSLDELQIPYLLESSGNRGFHVWLNFTENISYSLGYYILEAILEKINLDYDHSLIAIDLFPKSQTPSDGVGNCVKLPLSKHKKSNKYSILLKDPSYIDKHTLISELSENIIVEQTSILTKYNCISKSEIEKKLKIIFTLAHDEKYPENRIKEIVIDEDGFDFHDILSHWEKSNVLQILSNDVISKSNLNNEKRKLIVGMYRNVVSKKDKKIGEKILHHIFSLTENYNYDITEKAIRELSSYYFPSQNQIEKVLGESFEDVLSKEDYIKVCIPNYLDYSDASFDFSKKDIDIVRIAELNYVFQNDEVQSRSIINELSNIDIELILKKITNLIEEPMNIEFLKHIRNEESKQRILHTLGSTERIFTSSIIKQFNYFFDFNPSIYSYGYRLNKGFVGGYIFEPWLYLWIKFLSNISTAIQDENNQKFYIIKTDIKQFYDKIPHDNIKRMLLGGVNKKIDKCLDKLSDEQSLKYKHLVHSLLEINSKIISSNIGLPQGPAYARYLSELYLDNLDIEFENKIKSSQVLLYQRYVDDIFIIVSSEEEAKETLLVLEEELTNLGLDLNQGKTIIRQLRYFSDDFNSYRSQSKYAVDHVSKNFSDATDTQKDLAINEFMKLIESESCQEDLTFIFSHLTGVREIDKLKIDKVVPVLKSKIGRGSLFKHLFNFILENESNWSLLYEIDKFDALQSEVFTSSIINFIETNEENTTNLSKIVLDTETKLTRTSLVDSHLAYIYFKFGIEIEILKIEPTIILKILASSIGYENFKISNILVNHLNTELNNIKFLPSFIESLYPLCVSKYIRKEDLNKLSYTFYAKLSNDQKNGILEDSIHFVITTESIANKYYYLLCLFSISDANTSLNLLEIMWKFCARVFNEVDTLSGPISFYNWVDKIELININQAKALFVLTSIVDGNIFRGLDDEKKVFETFHNIIFLFITSKKIILDNRELTKALDKLKTKATFYKWIIENENVCQFPEKIWFEKNITRNNVVLLKKGNELLIRKPLTQFHSGSNPLNKHNGYGEIIEPYNPQELSTITQILENLDFKERLELLYKQAKEFMEKGQMPNIFCNAKILKKSSLIPFSNELNAVNSLIFQSESNEVESFDLSLENFIHCFFNTNPSGNNGFIFKNINAKYFQNIIVNIDRLEFIKNISNQLNDINDNSSEFYNDIAIASGLYATIIETDVTKRIDQFVTQYHKFNTKNEDRHIYCVTSQMHFTDTNPEEMLISINDSLHMILNDVLPSLSFYLGDDFKLYLKALKKLINSDETDHSQMKLHDFTKGMHKISPTTRTIKINGNIFDFDNVKMLNIPNMTIQTFEAKYSVLIDSSEHVYFLPKESTVYILALPSCFTRVYTSINNRLDTLLENGDKQSFPTLINELETDSINYFDDAITSIILQKDVGQVEASNILKMWLRSLPKKYHQSMVSLVCAHETMTKTDIETFINKVKDLVKNKNENPFLIKNPVDYNGTYRVIYKNDDALGRKINVQDPLNIADNSTVATMIVDNIISGTQASKALKYYIMNNGKNENYFVYGKKDKRKVVTRFKGLTKLNICSILYTDKGIEKIKDVCKKIINDEIIVEVISGRAINGNAFFESSEKIGSNDKASIINILTDHNSINDLYSRFEHGSSKSHNVKPMTLSELNKMNLVARYQSLPKKSFDFLSMDLKHIKGYAPFMRIKENYEE